jgi:hypothetical protein
VVGYRDFSLLLISLTVFNLIYLSIRFLSGMCLSGSINFRPWTESRKNFSRGSSRDFQRKPFPVSSQYRRTTMQCVNLSETYNGYPDFEGTVTKRPLTSFPLYLGTESSRIRLSAFTEQQKNADNFGTC